MNEDVFTIIATGPSMTQDAADYVQGKTRAIAVSNAFELAPWAEALVSHDRAWWRAHRRAFDFAGDKYSKHQMEGTKVFAPQGMPLGCNSGLMAMYLARHRKAKKILLLGFDMHGTHYFGRHPDGLKNTNAARFRQHMHQFRFFSGPEVINCTPGSALKMFPMADIKDII